MYVVEDFCRFLETFAPRELAEDWDNIGLLVGQRSHSASKVMTCLTVTPESVEEAVELNADLIVCHHPFPFRPIKRITADDVVGRMLLSLIENQIAVFSPHTSFDSAQMGINQLLGEGLSLNELRPIRIAESTPEVGAGRWGVTDPVSAGEFSGRVKKFLNQPQVRLAGDPNTEIKKVAVACGSAGEFLADADLLHCDLLVTGETSFHTCLDALARGMKLVLVGHYASERFAVEWLATHLCERFAEAEIWPSTRESDPLQWL